MSADVDEMQHMLEDYLAFARGATGEEAVRTPIPAFLEDVRDAAEAATPPGKSISLNYERAPAIAMLKRNAFKRALLNLLNNAMRYANRVVLAAAGKGGELIITVEDDGPGIPESAREAVFRPFYRLDDARNQNVKSTGLGLAITRDIIRAHGGEIELGESTLGGLKATVKLPL
jgi:two-component system osmolarity sensor histidine kinase EnvZ